MANGVPARTPDQLLSIFDVSEEEFLRKLLIDGNGDPVHEAAIQFLNAVKVALTTSDEAVNFWSDHGLGKPELANPVGESGRDTRWSRRETPA